MDKKYIQYTMNIHLMRQRLRDHGLRGAVYYFMAIEFEKEDIANDTNKYHRDFTIIKKKHSINITLL